MRESRAAAAWWEIRRAQNLKPASYRCPLCGERLPALSEHMLIIPEGQRERRRHAHTPCVLNARRNGKLPTRGEWLAAQPRPPRLGMRGRLALLFTGKRAGPPPTASGK